MERNSLDKSFFGGEFFARLYCKEKGIIPSRCYAHYNDRGTSSIDVEWEIGKEYHKESVEILDVLNLISKYVLKSLREKE